MLFKYPWKESYFLKANIWLSGNTPSIYFSLFTCRGFVLYGILIFLFRYNKVPSMKSVSFVWKTWMPWLTCFFFFLIWWESANTISWFPHTIFWHFLINLLFLEKSDSFDWNIERILILFVICFSLGVLSKISLYFFWPSTLLRLTTVRLLTPKKSSNCLMKYLYPLPTISIMIMPPLEVFLVLQH